MATPEADTERIRGQAVTELAVADAVPEGFTTADLAVFDFQGSAPRGRRWTCRWPTGASARKCSEAAARRAVSAWAEAVDGQQRPPGVARPCRGAAAAAVRRRPQRWHARLVVRGPAGACAGSASPAWTPRQRRRA